MRKYLSLGLMICCIVILSSCESYVEKKENNFAVETSEEINASSIGVKENSTAVIKEKVYKEQESGDRFQQNVKGNAKGGYQWKWVSTKNCLQYEDELCNFYDLESTTEIGDIFYFLKGIQAGDDTLIFTLYDTRDDKVYCEVAYDLTVDTKLNITLKKKKVIDNRGENLKEYTFDEPRVFIQGDEH